MIPNYYAQKCIINQSKHILEFQQPAKEVGSGTGLGLSIAYEIVKKHQGEIIVDTTTGKGTTFTIKLPLTEDKGAYRAGSAA